MKQDNAPLILYGTAACHLCEQAAALLRAFQEAGFRFDWEECDIADDDRLFARYGTTIPVLRRADGRELYWPFEPQELAGFLS